MMSDQTLIFQMNVGNGPHRRIVQATMYIHRTKSQHKRATKHEGWKASISYSGTRLFGSWRPTIGDAVDAVLKRHYPTISDCDRRRLTENARRKDTTAQLLLTHSCCNHRDFHTGDTVAQPLCVSEHVSPVVDAAHSHAHEQSPRVRYVHQMYGLYGDDKPMSDLFETSRRAWSDVAAGMGARYILWSAAEVEALVKHRYPQHWDMYCDVRYPIMRCDIGRIAILHSYGGLYADLDTYPNRAWYAQAELALQRVTYYKSESASAIRKSARPPAKIARLPKRAWRANLHGSQACVALDMEVIIGAAGHHVFVDWLNYIDTQIQCKPYADTRSFWYAAKMRYVFQTTGPYSMNRFLKLKSNATTLRNLTWLDCNHFKDADSLTANRKRLYDVISFRSQSYFTQEHSIHVAVGHGDAVLPTLPTAKRLRVKSADPRLPTANACSSLARGDATVLSGSQPSQEAHSEDVSPPPVDEAAAADDITSRIDGTLDLKSNFIADRLSAPMITAVGQSVIEARTTSEDRCMMNQMKLHFNRYKNCVAAKVLMEEMPRELREWITAHGGSDDA